MQSQLPYPASYDIDTEAELADARYRSALARVTVGDVLSEVEHVIAEEPDERKHPLYALAIRVLRHGGYRQTGQRTHMAEFLTAKYEDLLDLAIERLVQEELSHFGPWED
jgi:hypothetical protein